MAGNKINAKTKGKEDKNKSNKSIVQGNEENEDTDFSILRKPILTSVTGFAQARKIFDLATEELKNLLSNECDLLYECKVCRNIFRSLANFISHKRIYCKEKFNSTQHGHFFKTDSAINEMLKIKKLEETYLKTLSDKNITEDIETDELDGRIPLTKDLTTIIEKIVRNQGVFENNSDKQNVIFQKIPNSSVAVFQNVENSEEKLDKMSAQVRELDVILSKDKAVLQSDGNFKIQSSLPSDTDNVIQISDDDDEVSHDLKCKICDQNFSTQKTLKFHMKYKHVESRLVYPCPDCLEIFSTSWSVYRHLFKVHRKSAAQIRRLRESIQAKAFKMNNPPAFYEKRKNMKPVTQKISEEERLDQENQAWMDNVEGDGSVPRCFGCGRTFERRAALAAHAHTCQPRTRALQPRRAPPDAAKRIEIQIRKDYHKGPPAPRAARPPAEPQGPEENKVTIEEVPPPPNPVKEEKEPEKEVENESVDEKTMETMEDEEKSNDTTTDSPEKSADYLVPLHKSQVTLKLPFAHQAEKSNLTAFRQRIQPDIEVNTLLCKKCDIQHNTVQELYDHMAGHYKWMRYACKLCNFKTYYFSKLPEHLKLVHKLKGDIDFYFSTVKAIDGNEATELSENVDELVESNEVSPDSRRQSRCSSDSSRVSDDSSSSSTRTELGSRKRKIFSSKGPGKRKKEVLTNDHDDDSNADMVVEKDNNSISMEDTSSMSKTFEENSSDMDDIEEKISKRQIEIASSVASRRPVRKKTKRKNEDFEYDLSNLLKMEAQGYRDSQATSTNTKTSQSKKKAPQQDSLTYYEIINRDCCGALATLSKKSVECSAAHIKNTSFIYVTQKEPRSSNIFVRPMIPKIISRTEKNSPKKDIVEESKEAPSPQKESTVNKNVSEEIVKDCENLAHKLTKEVHKEEEEKNKDQSTSNSSSNDAVKPNVNIPAVLPIKFRRQSLELIKNPIINKNITDFKKAGMKTKILVIKPINRNKDGTPVPNTPLKFQTIKLKDPSKSSSSEEKSSDQVVVVKVPKVDTISRNVIDANATNSEKVKSTHTNSNTLNNNVANNVDDHEVIEDDKSDFTGNSPTHNEDFCIESKIITNDTTIVSNECKPVSDAKELITDKETLQNVSDST